MNQTTKTEAPRETTFCPKCQMNVMNTRIEHHQTWCNKELSISTQSALAIDALTRSLGAAAKPAHTPGPWKIDENEELPLAVIQDNEDGEGVCEIGKPGSTAYSATPEQWANARLIAAAPELLAVLRILVQQEWHPHLSTLDAARAAIAKAVAA